MVFKRGRPPGKMLQLSGPEPTKAPSPPWEKNPEWLARRLVAVPSLCPPRPNGASPGTRQAAQPAGEATSKRRQLGSPGRWGPEETRREPVPRLEPDRVSSHVQGPAPSLRGWREPHRAWGGHFQILGEPQGGALAVSGGSAPQLAAAVAGRCLLPGANAPFRRCFAADADGRRGAAAGQPPAEGRRAARRRGPRSWRALGVTGPGLPPSCGLVGSPHRAPLAPETRAGPCAGGRAPDAPN